jgi:hypothetical protein
MTDPWLTCVSSRGFAARVTARVILVVWAAFWLFFACAEAAGDGGGAWIHAVRFCAPIVALVSGAFLAPLWGGLGLIIVGAWAATYFHNVFTILTLAMPAVLAGALLVRWR